MKILQIIHCFPPESMTGSEIYAYNLSIWLSKRHDVSVFYRVNNPAFKEYEVIKSDYDGLSVYKINHTFKDYDSIEKIYNNKEIENRFLKVLDGVNPDIVHIQHLLFLSLGLIDEIKKRNIPVIFTLHDYWLMCPKGQLFKSNKKICQNPLDANCPYCLSASLNPRVLVKKIFKVLTHYKIPTRFKPDMAGIYRGIDLFISPSNFLRNRFIEFGLPPEKIIYSDNGMNPDLFRDIEKIKSGKIRFGFIGTLMPAKGAHVLIEAFNKVKSSKAVLKIYGKSPVSNFIFSYTHRIRRMARGMKNIEFMGTYDNKNVAKIFKDIDVLIFSSVWEENSPLVLHEAILTKTPALASDIGGVSEIIKHGKNGFLFCAGDANSLSLLIKKVIENPEIIENLKKDAVQVKDMDFHCKEIEAIYIEKARRRIDLKNARFQNMAMNRFSIIIVAYNSERHIRQCLDSIFKQDFSGYEIILVNNASSDRTVGIIDEYKHRVNIKNNSDNLGFSEAINIGIALSKGEYILTLNPDVVLENNFLSEINRNIDKLDKNIGMMGVKILKANSDNIIDSTGLVLSRLFRFFDRGSGVRDKGQYDKDVNILGPCAAAGIYKRTMLEDVSMNGEYFDKDFFYLIEDFDIALRARRKGWKCFYLPEAVCYHERNGSGMTYKYRQYFAFRNRYLFIIKNIEMKPEFIFYFLVYDIPRFIFLFLINAYTIKATREVGQFFLKMLTKRRFIISA